MKPKTQGRLGSWSDILQRDNSDRGNKLSEVAESADDKLSNSQPPEISQKNQKKAASLIKPKKARPTHMNK